MLSARLLHHVTQLPPLTIMIVCVFVYQLCCYRPVVSLTPSQSYAPWYWLFCILVPQELRFLVWALLYPCATRVMPLFVGFLYPCATGVIPLGMGSFVSLSHKSYTPWYWLFCIIVSQELVPLVYALLYSCATRVLSLDTGLFLFI